MRNGGDTNVVRVKEGFSLFIKSQAARSARALEAPGDEGGRRHDAVAKVSQSEKANRKQRNPPL